MIGHPSFHRLRAFALVEDEARARRPTARHLETCARCRARVHAIRDVIDGVRRPGVGAPFGFDRIADRIAAGDSVLLPIERSRHQTPPRRPHRAITVAAMIVLLAAIVVGVPEAVAEKSELWFTPEKPRAGATLSLRYQATTRLRGKDRLIVRARYHTGARGSEPRTEVIGELTISRGGRFDGRVLLPDSAVYAVLAVETTDASFVDSYGERWEVLVHGEDGRPLLAALRARMHDNRRRNTIIASEATRTMTELYPDRAEGWYLLYGDETMEIPRDAIDSVRRVFRPELERLERLAADAPSIEPDELWYLVMFAGSLGETQAQERLRDTLTARFPTSGAALQQAAFRASERSFPDRRGYVAALDSLWRVAPDSAGQAAFYAWQAAQKIADPDLLLLWTERFERTSPEWTASNGLMLARNAATRDAGIARLRNGIAELANAPGERPLTSTAAEHAAQRRRIAGRYLAALGRALLDSGLTRAALDTLDRALETGWDPDLFRAVGDARLELGDTAGALEAFARLAADPTTSAAFADSLRAQRGAAAMPATDWSTSVEDARNELRRELLDASFNRAPVRNQLRLSKLDGAPHHVRLDEGGITVVAFWSRYCPPSRAQLTELDDIAARLIEHGIRFIGITDEADADDVAAFLEANGHTFPTYLDPERDARNAFDNRATPSYAVLDEYGRIRFMGHSTSDILRQVAVLGGPWSNATEPPQPSVH